MTPALQLDLNSMAIDSSLARRVPYALSRYYLALPLGEENGSVSVAMAYPENVNAQHVLSHLLQARVVPVYTPAEMLLPAMERIYHPQDEERHAILAWYEQAGEAAAVETAVSLLRDALHVSATTYSAADLSLDEVLDLAAGGQSELLILPAPAAGAVLNQAAVPLFFVRGRQPLMRSILVVMRGFASDERALDWLAAFAWQQPVTVTLMPLFGGPGAHLHPYRSQNSPAARHLDRCVQRLQADGVTVTLKYRFGEAIQQVVEEVAGGSYDLLVLAAEAEGDFVSRVITAVERRDEIARDAITRDAITRDAHQDHPIFVLKPPELPH